MNSYDRKILVSYFNFYLILLPNWDTTNSEISVFPLNFKLVIFESSNKLT
jgi:hypothetical protein